MFPILLGDSKYRGLEVCERETPVTSSGLERLLVVIVLVDLILRVEHQDLGLPHAKGGGLSEFERGRLRPQEPFVGVVWGCPLDSVVAV